VGNPGGWDATRYMITDEMWAVIEKCLAKAKIEKRGRPAEISDRKFLEALLYLARTGIPWRDLPREFGKWDAIDHRYRRWLKNGTLQRLFELLTAHPELAAIRRILIDATNVRSHRCAAGAPKKGVCLRAGSWSESGWILDEDGAHCHR
jgi:transposase